MTDQRLDELTATLAATRPVLDDLTRARVGADLRTAIRAPAPVHRPSHARWAIGAAIAAPLVVGLALLRPELPVAPAPAGTASELTDGELLSAPRDGTVRSQVDGAALSLYGPGWATRHGRRVIVNADAFVVDRLAGDAPLELLVRDATIYVHHATFSVDGTHLLRVTVMRGELLLHCGDTSPAQRVAVGSSATCPSVHLAQGRSPLREPPPQPPTTSTSPTPPASTTSPANRTSARGTADASRISAVAALRELGEPLLDLGRPPPDPSPQDPAGVATNDRGGATAAEPPAPPSSAARYAAAERLMASDPAAARRALIALVTEEPAAPEAAPALLDLARLAAADGNVSTARAALDTLASHPAAATLALPAAYLRCTLERSGAGRRTCLSRFRAAFPGSLSDADILAYLAVEAARAGDCPTSLPLLDEYAQRYPAGRHAAIARAWRAHCDRATPRP